MLISKCNVSQMNRCKGVEYPVKKEKKRKKKYSRVSKVLIRRNALVNKKSSIKM